MKKEQYLVIKFAFLMLLVYSGNALSTTLLIPYLSGRGFDELRMGCLFTWASVLSIVFQVLFGYLCDKLRTNKWIFYLVSALCAVATWQFYVTKNQEALLLTVWFCLLSGFGSVIEGVLDSWVIESHDYCLTNYGWIRAFAALGWAVGAQITALIIMRYNYRALGPTCAILTIITLVYGLIISDAQKVNGKEKLKLNEAKSLLLNRNFVLLTTVLFFMFLAGGADYYTSIYKLQYLGAGEKELSLLNSTRALFEIPFFFIGGWIIKKFGALRVLTFVILVYVIRYLLYGLATNPSQIIWVATLQAFTFPLITISTKMLVDEASPPNLRTSGQQLAASVYGSGSLLLVPSICGILIKQFSYDVTLFLIAGFSLLPGALLLYYRKLKTENSSS